jgi:hypothetical protein
MHILRQICVGARHLAPVVEQLATVFGLDVCHRAAGVARFGLENAVLAFGTQFFEVVGPIRDGTALGHFLDRLGSDGGYMVITQAEDLAPFRARAQDLGLRTAYEWESLEEGYHVWQLHPADMGVTFLEIDTQVGGLNAWYPAGKQWQIHAQNRPLQHILGVELRAFRIADVAKRWAALCGRPLQENADGLFRFSLDNAALRFVEAQANEKARFSAVDLEVRDIAPILAAAKALGLLCGENFVEIGGMRFNLQSEKS